MKTFLLSVGVLILVISGPTFGAIVYSGSQNVTLRLGGGPDPPPVMQTISIADDATSEWDDFVISLQYYMDPMTMVMGTTLVIGGADMGMGGPGMGQVVGIFDAMMMPLVFNLARGMLISVDSPMLQSGFLLEAMNGETYGEFGAAGGYIGLVMPGSTYYGWLHMSSMSDIGGPTQTVAFDGWAYENQSDVPIHAGDIPEPSILLLCSAGGLAAWLRRRRAL